MVDAIADPDSLSDKALEVLQQAITDGPLPSFKDLTSTTDHAFYGAGSGLNYAMARYLCYYLQEHGLLRDYYHGFVAHHAQDPAGYGALARVLGNDGNDMTAFQRRWERWVMTLRFE